MGPTPFALCGHIATTYLAVCALRSDPESDAARDAVHSALGAHSARTRRRGREEFNNGCAIPLRISDVFLALALISPHADVWDRWNELRSVCSHHQNLRPLLEFSLNLPSKESFARWTGEGVKGIVLPTSIFLTSGVGTPTLSRRHQEYVSQLLRFNVQVILQPRTGQASARIVRVLIAMSDVLTAHSGPDFVCELPEQSLPPRSSNRCSLPARGAILRLPPGTAPLFIASG